MPLFIRLPRNEHLLKRIGPYRSHLNVLNRKHTAIQRSFRRAGLAGTEPETQGVIFAICDVLDDIVFYDVGAHIGMYSALVEAIYGCKTTRIYAFEPTPETADICRKLRNRNGLGYKVVEQAVTSEVGDVDLYISPKAETSNSLDQGFRNAIEAVSVKATTIDQFVNEGACPPSLIKIDVETHEPHVLLGGMKTIRRFRPWIVCELLPKADPDGVATAVHQLSDAGYSFFHIAEQLERYPPGEVVSSIRSDENRNWLMAPEPLPNDFVASMDGWARSIAACGPETNILTEPGSAEPPQTQGRYTSSDTE